MIIPDVDIAKAIELYEAGQYRQGYEVFKPYGPPTSVEGTRARIMLARLANNLEAPRLASWLIMQAYRSDPGDPEVRYYYLRTRLERHGPLEAWKMFSRIGDLEGGTDTVRSDWYGFGGLIAAILRDFEVAERWIGRAREISPDNPWIHVEACAVYELADRYNDALASARHSLELSPRFRPGIQSLARSLKLLGRHEEALQVLTEAAKDIESPRILAELAQDQIEREMFEEASATIDRYEELAVMMEPAFREYVASLRSTVAYHLDQYSSAVSFARNSNHPFFISVAGNIENARTDARRVLLPVAFIRQHHMTCAPATLTAIARFWSKPADHLEVAEEICYGGTQAYNERLWAEQNGWATREFTVTWESARALIDRGIPFTLTTVGVSNAHLQAVIGYDERRGTLLLRDPFYFYVGEALAREMIESQSPYGPRGMALVPVEKRDLLDDIELPEAALHDRLHAVQIALTKHEREAAWTQYRAMEEEAAGHRLTLWARRNIAFYDSDWTEQLGCVEQLLSLFPEEPNLLLSRLSLLQMLSRRVDYEAALLEYSSSKPKRRSRTRGSRGTATAASVPEDGVSPAVEAAPLIWERYAAHLSQDARNHGKAYGFLRRGLRLWPTNPSIIYGIAELWWMQRRFADAEEMFRFAACLEDKDEGYAGRYFAAARHRRHTDDALRMLRDRYERFGTRSSLPARTLFRALSSIGMETQAYDVLDNALTKRPDDGMLHVFAAGERADLGQFEVARDLLARCDGKTPRAAWMRAAAGIAAREQERERAIDLWRAVLGLQPLAMDAHAALVRLLAEMSQKEAVISHLEQAITRFPFHNELHRLYAGWLDDFGEVERRERVLRQIVAFNPSDAWGRRELADVLIRSNRFDEAREHLDMSGELDPNSPFHYNMVAEYALTQEQWQEAREALRQAIKLSIDNSYAIRRLIDIADTPEEARREVEFVESELIRQTTFGDGLQAFRVVAADTIAADEVLEALAKAHDARPDLWHAWSCLIQQSIACAQYDKALQLAVEATERFPLNAQLWLDLGLVHEAGGRTKEERAALRKALEVNPGWTAPIRKLCASYERHSDLVEAKELMQTAIQHAPLDARNHAKLADVLWRLDEKEAAFARMVVAVKTDNAYEWAWDRLTYFAEELERYSEVESMVRELIAKWPSNSTLWVHLARCIPDNTEAQIEALNRAIEINPREFDARDTLAQILVSEGRFEEALAACSTVADIETPVALRGRAAWVKYKSGDKPAAADMMRSVLAIDPRYSWGWQLLARWADEADRNAEYQRAAQVLTQLRPQDGTAFALLAHAETKLNNRDAAKAAYQRALRLRPNYQFAATSLFDLYLNNDQLGAAAAVVEEHALALRDGGADVSCAVRLCVRRGETSEALALLRKLTSIPGCGESIDDALGALSSAGLAAKAAQILREAVCAESVEPGLGAIWARVADRIDYRIIVSSLQDVASSAAIEAATDYLHRAGKTRDGVRVDAIVSKHAELLKSNDRLWGSVGYAYTMLGRRREAYAWLADWERRDAADPWMLVNFAEAAWLRGNRAEVVRVCRHGLTLRSGNGKELHGMWLALDAALNGDFSGCVDAAARAHFLLDDEYAFFAQLLNALGALDGGPVAFSTARRFVERALSAMPDYRKHPLCVSLHRAVVRCIVNTVGTLTGRIWGMKSLYFGG